MWQTKIRSWAFVGLMCFVVASAGCQSTLTSQELRGTIYYEDETGVWKITLPDKQPSQLASVRAAMGLSVSPDQKWLLYDTVIPKKVNNQWLRSMWILSTHGGAPIQVSNEVPLLWTLGWENGWLRYTELSDFQVDPNTGQTTPHKAETFSFDPGTNERRLESQTIPLSPTLLGPGSCQELTLTPAEQSNLIEKCVDMSGNGFLRVCGLDSSNPITVSLAYPNDPLSISGDQKWLAFSGKDSHDRPQAFVLNIRDKKIQQITGKDSMDENTLGAPSWSPNNRWLAFQTARSADYDLCVTEVETGMLKCFQGYVSEYGAPPDWSPDSQAIVLSSNRIGKLAFGDAAKDVTDLFIVRIPEGDVIQLTHNLSAESSLIWVR